MGWQLAAGLNLSIAIAYVAIGYLIFLGLKRTNQLRTNKLALATGTIFITCAIHHAHHGIHLLGLIGHHSAYDLGVVRSTMGGVHSVAIDLLGAVVAFVYLGLRRSYVALLHTPAMFEDAVRVEAEQRLSKLAYTDALTGCANRTAYQEYVDGLAGSNTPVAMVFMDVDGFKQVNDLHGHDLGDRLLSQLGGRLAAAVSSSERVFRLGGDEFVIVQVGQTPEGLDNLVTRCRATIHEPMLVREGVLWLSASIGWATGPADDKLDRLLRQADQAMYEAKENRPGRTMPTLSELPGLHEVPDQRRESDGQGAHPMTSSR